MPSLSAAVVVNCFRHKLFAGSRFPADQDRGVSLRDFSNHFEHVQHPAAGTDHPPRSQRILPFDTGAQVRDFPIERGMREGAFHGQRDFFQIEWLHHEIVCAESDRLNRVVTGTECSDDNDRNRGKPLLVPNVPEDILASKFRHPPIAEYEIRGRFLQEIYGFHAVPGFQDFIASSAQNLRKRFAEVDFIVDDENGLTHVWL
jgi:hypothetical protein